MKKSKPKSANVACAEEIKRYLWNEHKVKLTGAEMLYFSQIIREAVIRQRFESIEKMLMQMLNKSKYWKQLKEL